MVHRADQTRNDPYERMEHRLRTVERELRELRAGRRLESASIGKGGITVKNGGALRILDADGNLIGLIGDLSELRDGQRGFVLLRAGGYPALSVNGTGQGSDFGFVGLYDVAGNYVVTDDAASRRGLGRPYIPIQMGEVTAVPTATAASATFSDLYVGMTAIQHPVLYAYLLVRASDSTTAGEVRVAVDGTAVGPTLPVTAGSYTYAGIGPFRLPAGVLASTYGAVQGLSVQARRTAGTGSVGVRVLSVLGLESAFAP